MMPYSGTSQSTGADDPGLQGVIPSMGIPDSMIVAASESDFRRLLVGLIERNHQTTKGIVEKISTIERDLAVLNAQDLPELIKDHGKRLDALEASGSVVKWLAGALFGALLAIIVSYFSFRNK